jgi:hypothetical protein
MRTKIIAMNKDTNEEQTPRKPENPACQPDFPIGKRDHRLPHEIAAVILMAAYEVVDKKLACERESISSPFLK